MSPAPPFELLVPDDRHPERRRALAGRALPESLGSHRAAARHYQPDADLVDAVNVCLGLAAGALAVAAAGRVVPAAGDCPTAFAHRGDRPVEVKELSQRAGDGCRVGVLTPRWLETAEAPAGGLVRVDWEVTPRPCVERRDDASEIWRCGGGAPPRLGPDLLSSVVLLATRRLPPAPEIENLVVALLASGSATQVEIAQITLRDDPAIRLFLSQVPLADAGSQYLMLLDFGDTLNPRLKAAEPAAEDATRKAASFVISDWEELLPRLGFQGVRTAREVFSVTGASLLSGDPERVLLRGLTDVVCPREKVDENGFVFVRLCPGTFRMGSEEGETLADRDEFPAHTVTLSGFAIGKYEVTNRQYRLRYPDHSGEDDLPATDVSWSEADDFCRSFGHRLPTEAEWEYAARAGTTTAWSSGDDEGELQRYAWYGEEFTGQPHPVGTREPNPWGIHDLHGNVWEWVADWYGPYTAADQRDPTGPEDGVGRVLRGGSFAFPARNLRSAGRNGDQPGDRDGDIGFRCVRGSRRQP